MTPFASALAMSLAAAAVTTAGIVVIRHRAAWGRRHTPTFIGFAAGVLLAASFLHLIPKAFALHAGSPIWMLAGFFGLHLVNRFLTAFVCERDPALGELPIGVLPMVGIGLHSLVDGMVYAVTFQVGPLTGLLSTMGMVLHEFPEGIVTYLLLVRAGLDERSAAMLAFAAAAATTPVGLLVAWPMLDALDDGLLGRLLALSAGALVYVGATHLLPRVERERWHHSLGAVAAGLALAAVVVLIRG